jgi:hypothetical protein
MSPTRPKARGFGAMEFVVRPGADPGPQTPFGRYYGFYSSAARGKLAGRALLPRGGARVGNDAAKGRTRIRTERGEKCRRGSVPMPSRGVGVLASPPDHKPVGRQAGRTRPGGSARPPPVCRKGGLSGDCPVPFSPFQRGRAVPSGRSGLSEQQGPEPSDPAELIESALDVGSHPGNVTAGAIGPVRRRCRSRGRAARGAG